MGRTVEDMVNEQIARWRMDLARDPMPAERANPTAVTVAHAFGSNGAVIAFEVGALLGIPVHDRQIVEHIATRSGVRTDTVQCLDERGRGRLEDFLGSLFRERGFHQSDYLRHVTEAVLALWQHGSSVMVGHGCVHIIPRQAALAVRLVAPFQHRVDRVASRGELAPAEAERIVRSTDDERAAFHRRHFGANVDDVLLYDLVLDTAVLSVDACAAIVAEGYRQKFPGGRFTA